MDALLSISDECHFWLYGKRRETLDAFICMMSFATVIH